MADIRDIYASVIAVQDEIIAWLDLHDNETGGACRCTSCYHMMRLYKLTEDTRNLRNRT